MNKYCLYFVWINLITISTIIIPSEPFKQDPAFIKLEKAHKDYKQRLDILADKKKKQEITDQEFDQQRKSLKKTFDSITKKIKDQHPNHAQYSLQDSEQLIKELREQQAKEEHPFQEQYLKSKETYNRPVFDKERKKIEREHEILRAFISLFTNEPKTTSEHAFVGAKKTALEDLKQNLLKLRETYLKNPSFENDLKYQQEAEKLIAEHQNTLDSLIQEYLLETEKDWTEEFADQDKAPDAKSSIEAKTVQTVTENMANTANKIEEIKPIGLPTNQAKYAKLHAHLAKYGPSKL